MRNTMLMFQKRVGCSELKSLYWQELVNKILGWFLGDQESLNVEARATSVFGLQAKLKAAASTQCDSIPS